jgi:hypothetical protein
MYSSSAFGGLVSGHVEMVRRDVSAPGRLDGKLKNNGDR